MKRAGRIIVGIAAFAMTAGAAMAADIPVVAPPAPPPPPAPVATFDWAGIYVGAHVGSFFGGGPINYGVHGGYNIVNGRLVYGVDVRASAYGAFTIYEVMLRARAGFLLRDRLLVFGAAGIGWADAPAVGFELGGGVELAVGQRLSIRAEVNQTFIGLAPAIPTFYSVGLTFHLGN